MTKLHLASGLELPLDVVTQKLAFLGRTGSGKTYGATKLAELLLAHDAQLIALDPVGVWYGLRVGADFRIPVFGGLHGDLPLESTAGAVLADLVIDRGISAVLDVSQFETDAQKARFAEAFASRFFFRKKAAPAAVHLFLEECQEFVPQNPQGGDAQMLHAFTRLAKLGRNFGIGLSLISQRPQEINKKVLNMTEVMLAFQMRGPQERKTIKDWSSDKDLEVDIVGELPGLAVGECFVSSPQWLQVERKVRIAKKVTADVSSTPKVGVARTARELTPIDLEQLRQTMAATIEKAKADDPRELRKEIARLKSELAKGAKSVPAPPDPAAVQHLVDAGVAAAMKKEWQRLRTVKELLASTRSALAGAHTAAQKLPALLDGAIAGVDMATEQLTQSSPAPTVARAPAVSRASRAAAVGRPGNRTAAPGPSVASTADGELTKGERVTLTAIAQHDAGVTREQLTTLTGYRRSTRNLYLQQLVRRGFIEARGETLSATPAGTAALGTDFEPLPTGDALLEYWLGRLPEGERRILQALVDVYPDGMDRDALSGHTGYKRSTRNLYVQHLQRRKLVESHGSDVRASDLLFSEATR